MSTNSNQKIGVLLMAYGSPDRLEDVEAYLRDIRGGIPPEERMTEMIRERYRSVGGKTPLNEITRRQAEAVQERLGRNYKVLVGMKHWQPRIAEAVSQMEREGIERIVGVALAPHYSRVSIGGYKKRVEEAIAAAGKNIKFTMIESWHTNSKLIECICQQLGDVGGVTVVFTAHSLPEKILASGDSYWDQLIETSRLVAQKAGVSLWEFCFQSAGHTGDKWLGPDIKDVLRRLGSEGKSQVVVCSIGFVSDNLEILYDLDIEAAGVAGDLGMKFIRVEMRNLHPKFIEAICEVVKAES